MIPVAVIAGLAIIARLASHSWTHPAALFPLIWTVHTVLPTLLAPDLPLYPSGIWWIALSCFAVQTGAFVTAPPTREPQNETAQRTIRTHLQTYTLRPLIVASICLCPVAILSAYFTIDASHRSLDNFTSFKALAKSAAAITVFRYAVSSKLYRPNLVVQFLFAANYMEPLVGGVIFALRRNRKDVLISFITILPALFVTVTQTTKASVLVAGVYWITAYVGSAEYIGGLPRWQRVTKGILLVCILVAILLGTAESLRGGTVPTLPKIVASLKTDRVRLMVFGHVFVFTEWFDESYQLNLEPTYGAYTFAGPADLLGFSARTVGVYSENKHLGSTNSNVYTYFRELIEDFTAPGALLLLCGAGAFGGWAYRGVGERHIGRLPWVILYDATALWFIVSLFTYNTLIVAFIGFTLYWNVITQPRQLMARKTLRTAPCPT